MSNWASNQVTWVVDQFCKCLIHVAARCHAHISNAETSAETGTSAASSVCPGASCNQETPDLPTPVIQLSGTSAFFLVRQKSDAVQMRIHRRSRHGLLMLQQSLSNANGLVSYAVICIYVTLVAHAFTALLVVVPVSNQFYTICVVCCNYCTCNSTNNNNNKGTHRYVCH